MSRISQAIVRFFLQGDLLHRFEKKVAKGETTSIDVFLEKEKGYILKGEILKCSEKPIMSLWKITGYEVPTKPGNSGKYLSVVPDRDGTYSIRVAVRSDTNGREQVIVAVSIFKQIAKRTGEFYA